MNGKEIWKSLKTAHFSVAEARLATFQKEHRERKGKEIDALSRSWPELSGTKSRHITAGTCREWAARYPKIASPSRYNNTLSLLRRSIDVAIQNGVVHANAAVGMERKPIRPKQLELPTLSRFTAFIAEMRAGHGRDSRHCADFVQGLAFMGCRISEAARIGWRDVDFVAGEILIKGDPEEATKNGEIRRVRIIPNARQLLTRMRASRSEEPATAAIFLVRESKKAINRAAKKIGMTRITPHDPRHFFATVSIESGVDMPTVAGRRCSRQADLRASSP